MDFTLTSYRNLLEALLAKDFPFMPFAQLLEHGGKQAAPSRMAILRHDVDLRPQNSLATAKLEAELGIRGSYYFRMVPESFDADIIRQIVDLGHEVGYHYETMDTAAAKLKAKGKRLNESDALIDAAYKELCENLEAFRRVCPVKTICMHGSPKSAFDNRDVWTRYDYRPLGIIGEPYFDIDFDHFFYLTDTGRCWNGHHYSVRDKMPQQERWSREGLVFSRTKDIVRAAQANTLPPRVMITVHPQRWTNSYSDWFRELVVQRLKNVVKWGLIRWKFR